MNVLSLFDGMSSGRIALERAGIKVDNYFASEVDKYAIHVTQHNYPDTIQLGDINNWREWDLPEIDLIIGGSPCQGFSIAGNGLDWEDPRSQLFFVFLEVLRHYEPRFFLFENVASMKEEVKDAMSHEFGTEPIRINSRLVSAQMRDRLYWSNFPMTQPENKRVYLQDVLESGDVNKDKSYAIDANYHKGGPGLNNFHAYFEKGKRQLVFERACQVAHFGENAQAQRVYSVRGKSVTLKGEAGGWGAKTGLYKVDLPDGDYLIRQLTPLECERLQTVPEGYTYTPTHPYYGTSKYGTEGNKSIGMSDTQRYKMLGNGWTVDVIAHLFQDMKENK